ncbi:MAG: AAA family ATPase, partial [Caldilineaceae bacterium]
TVAACRLVPLTRLNHTQMHLLIGIENIKNEVIQLVNFLKIQQLRHSKGMAIIPVSRHLVFYGNPGTGKTTVARLLARIYKSLNVISRGHLIETDRAGLVAGYVGQTALKTQDAVKQAIGGVLFIDEAYTLAGEGQDYGREAIDTLIKLMEDNRDDLIIIVAGYTDEMNRFLSSNPGLKSRFNKYFYFNDYDPMQLISIFELFCHNTEFNLSQAAKMKLLQIFESLYTARDKTFGNARLVRNIFEHTISNQANRLVTLANITDIDLRVVLDVDIPDNQIISGSKIA